MDGMFVTKKIAKWKICRLKPHPRQTVFRPHTQQEIVALAKKLDIEGLICPVEVTPDGYIICGHGRVAAAKFLGWRTIYVWVRHDLVEQGDGAVFQRFVDDNLGRRQLTKLGMGRAYLALKEQEYGEWRRKDQEQARGDFRDYLGELLGCDGTTAERWAKLAVLPSEYDHLLESNLLSQQQAARIVKNLPADIQHRLGLKLAGIAASNDDRKAKKRKIRAAVNAQLGSRPTAAKRADTTWQQALSTILGRVAQDPPAPIVEFVDHLERDGGFQSLMQTLRRKHPETVRALSRAHLDLDGIEEDQLKRSVLLMLGLLHAAESIH